MAGILEIAGTLVKRWRSVRMFDKFANVMSRLGKAWMPSWNFCHAAAEAETVAARWIEEEILGDALPYLHFSNR
jgi:hypothetical protein